MSGRPDRLPVYYDDRGSLLPIEFDDLDLDVRRAFVVAGTPQGCTRGGHAVPCAEFMVLLAGSATVRLTRSPRGESEQEWRLERVGDSAPLPAGWFVEYDLDQGESRVLVLAQDRYVPHPAPESDP